MRLRRATFLLTLLVTVVSSSTESEPCQVYLTRSENCYKNMWAEAGLSSPSDSLKTKHLVCCFTHKLLDCMEEAAAETSCQQDIREADRDRDHLLKYMRFRCDKYTACRGHSGPSNYALLTITLTAFSIIYNFTRN